LTVQPLAVTTGRTLGDALEIDSPELKIGDRLVLEPPAQLQAGTAVKVASK